MTSAGESVRVALADATSQLTLDCPDVNVVGMAAMVRDWLGSAIVSPDIAARIEMALERAASPSTGSNAAGVRLLLMAALAERKLEPVRITQREAQP